MVFPTKEHQATIEALVNGDETLALIDSCSTASIISSGIAEDLGLAIDTISARVLHTANGPLQTLGLAHFDLTLHPLKRRILAQVVQDFPYCLLLGTNIRKAFPGITVDFDTLTVFHRIQQVYISAHLSVLAHFSLFYTNPYPSGAHY